MRFGQADVAGTPQTVRFGGQGDRPFNALAFGVNGLEGSRGLAVASQLQGFVLRLRAQLEMAGLRGRPRALLADQQFQMCAVSLRLGGSGSLAGHFSGFGLAFAYHDH